MLQQLPAPRERVINRGLFVRNSIAGIEPDAFVLLGVMIGLTIIPSHFRLTSDLEGLAEGFIGYGLLRLLYQYEPRPFFKYRNFNSWRGVFRAKPPMIAGKPRTLKRKKAKT